MYREFRTEEQENYTRIHKMLITIQEINVSVHASCVSLYLDSQSLKCIRIRVQVDLYASGVYSALERDMC